MEMIYVIEGDASGLESKQAYDLFTCKQTIAPCAHCIGSITGDNSQQSPLLQALIGGPIQNLIPHNLRLPEEELDDEEISCPEFMLNSSDETEEVGLSCVCGNDHSPDHQCEPIQYSNVWKMPIDDLMEFINGEEGPKQQVKKKAEVKEEKKSSSTNVLRESPKKQSKKSKKKGKKEQQVGEITGSSTAEVTPLKNPDPKGIFKEPSGPAIKCQDCHDYMSDSIEDDDEIEQFRRRLEMNSHPAERAKPNVSREWIAGLKQQIKSLRDDGR